MDGPQLFQADDAVKLRQHPVQVAHEVISGVGDVAGVQADAHPVGERHPVQDGPQLLEPAAHLAALAGHGLQQHGGGLLRPEDGVEPLGDQVDAGLDALAHMAAGVEVVELPRQVLQPPEVVRHGLPGEEAVLLLRAAEVQDVGGVCHDGAEAALRQQVPEGGRVRLVQSFGLASSWVAGEELKGVRPQLQRLAAHGREALGGGQVTADIQHDATSRAHVRICGQQDTMAAQPERYPASAFSAAPSGAGKRT